MLQIPLGTMGIFAATVLQQHCRKLQMLHNNQQTALTLLWHTWLPDMHLETALKQPRKVKPAATTLTSSYQDSQKSYFRPFILSLSLSPSHTDL